MQRPRARPFTKLQDGAPIATARRQSTFCNAKPSRRPAPRLSRLDHIGYIGSRRTGAVPCRTTIDAGSVAGFTECVVEPLSDDGGDLLVILFEHHDMAVAVNPDGGEPDM